MKQQTSKFQCCEMRVAMNILNLILMIIILTALLIWSWNGQSLGVGTNLMFLCVHSLLWLNSFIFNRQIIYQIFLISYAILLVLRGFHLLIFSFIFFAHKMRKGLQPIEMEIPFEDGDDKEGAERIIPISAVFVLLTFGLFVLILGCLLEYTVYKVCRKMAIEKDREKMNMNTQNTINV